MSRIDEIDPGAASIVRTCRDFINNRAFSNESFETDLEEYARMYLRRRGYTVSKKVTL